MAEHSLPLVAYTPGEIKAFEKLDEQARGVLLKYFRELEFPSIRFQPTGDAIMVWRLEPKERKTEGGIVVPNFTMDAKEEATPFGTMEKTGTVANEAVVDQGILLSAGNGALDWMRANGVFLGDIIRFGHYAGREQSSQWFDVTGAVVTNPKSLLQLQYQDIVGSYDLHVRLYGERVIDKETGKTVEKKPTLRTVFAHDDEGNGVFVYKPITREET